MLRQPEFGLPGNNTASIEQMKPNYITKQNRIIIIIISLSLISISLFFGLRNTSISENSLQPIQVTLEYPPKYLTYKIKTTTYKDIVLQTKEYKKIFKITSFTYKATNHEALVSNVNAGDTILLKVRNSDISGLQVEDKWNDYNEVYGVTKKGTSYINLDLRNRLANKDSRWAFFIVLLGLVILPYGLIKSKPVIALDYALFGTILVELIVIFIFLKK